MYEIGLKKNSLQLKNLTIDVGASTKEEVEKMGIHVGTVVTFDADAMELNKKYIVARALDNRAGGFMIAEVARLLHENKKKLPFTLYVVNAVQEEIGLRGAEMVSRRIKPNVAIVTDVCHDTHSPMYNKKRTGRHQMRRWTMYHSWSCGSKQLIGHDHQCCRQKENILSTHGSQ